MRVLAIIEASTITGPAKNLIRFASMTKNPPPGEPGLNFSIATFSRNPGTPNAFTKRVESAGLPIDVIPERFAFDTRVLRGLRAVVAQRSPDIIQSHGVKSHFLVRLAGLHRRARWIAFHHGYTSVNAKMLAYNQLDRWSLRAPERVITVCGPFREELVRAGVDPGKIEILPNSIEAAPRPGPTAVAELRRSLQLDPNDFVAVSIGRLSKEKGHCELVSAAGRIARSSPSRGFRFVIAGDGTEAEALKRQADASGASFTFTGHMDNVAPLYAIANLFVLPSYSEGSPNVLLEAMAAGVPIVATEVGGVPETVENERSALLVPPRDPEALASAILRLASDPERAAALQLEARARVALRSPENYYRALSRIYGTTRPS